MPETRFELSWLKHQVPGFTAGVVDHQVVEDRVTGEIEVRLVLDDSHKDPRAGVYNRMLTVRVYEKKEKGDA